ncbi:MAG: cytochrome c [Patescibacteria group bacterium]
MKTTFAPPMLTSRKLHVAVLIAATAACGGAPKEPPSEDAAVAPGAVVATTLSPGQQVYQRCVTCHQLNGEGLPGTFPPLAGSEYANAANPAVPIRILLHGIEGPITVRGQEFSGSMPAFGIGIEMSNEEVAAVLTYIRSSFGNSASAVQPADVAATRAAPRARTGPVTAEELEALM